MPEHGGAHRDSVTVLGTGAAPCLLRGSRVTTPAGDIPVEEVLPGVSLHTLGGARRRVTWVGHRRIDLRRHPSPEEAHPVRIRRGALGNGAPCRDLLLCPGHGVLVGDVLVPARALVNGATVTRERNWQRADYVAIALDVHDVILADNAPVESLPPDAARAMLSGGSVIALHPRFPDPSAAIGDCAPRAATGPAAEAARRSLLLRARLLGHAITREPDLHLQVDGERINPSGISGPLYRFAVPSGARDLRIVSRAGIPAETDPASQDRRRLGVMLARLVLRTGRNSFDIPATDSSLCEGFHPPECSARDVWRWTDGHARLPALPHDLARLDLVVLGAQPSWARALPPDAPMHRSA